LNALFVATGTKVGVFDDFSERLDAF